MSGIKTEVKYGGWDGGKPYLYIAVLHYTINNKSSSYMVNEKNNVNRTRHMCTSENFKLSVLNNEKV
jgi:hypothetical protein